MGLECSREGRVAYWEAHGMEYKASSDLRQPLLILLISQLTLILSDCHIFSFSRPTVILRRPKNILEIVPRTILRVLYVYNKQYEVKMGKFFQCHLFNSTQLDTNSSGQVQHINTTFDHRKRPIICSVERRHVEQTQRLVSVTLSGERGETHFGESLSYAHQRLQLANCNRDATAFAGLRLVFSCTITHLHITRFELLAHFRRKTRSTRSVMWRCKEYYTCALYSTAHNLKILNPYNSRVLFWRIFASIRSGQMRNTTLHVTFIRFYLTNTQY